MSITVGSRGPIGASVTGRSLMPLTISQADLSRARRLAEYDKASRRGGETHDEQTTSCVER